MLLRAGEDKMNLFKKSANKNDTVSIHDLEKQIKTLQQENETLEIENKELTLERLNKCYCALEKIK